MITPSLSSPTSPPDFLTYVPGVCNIGSAEIRRRRRFGHFALAATIAAALILTALAAPVAAFLLVGLLAAAAAEGYLQAYLHFCAGFASRGLYNLGPVAGQTTQIASPEARLVDRAQARRISLLAGEIGLLVGLVAILGAQIAGR